MNAFYVTVKYDDGSVCTKMVYARDEKQARCLVDQFGLVCLQVEKAKHNAKE